MRESGFDPTDRFGPFGAGTTSLVPVCLNTLLYAMELDLAAIDTVLARPTDVAVWTAQAAARRARMDALLWDERAGFYFDYDFTRGARRAYPFATTFWPLWAGLATPDQARRVRDNLATFERPGGIVTSTHVSGSQWDAPFGWAPLQLSRRRGAAARRLPGRRRSARARLPQHARRRFRPARNAGREVRRRAPHLGARRARSSMATRATRSASAGRTRSRSGSCASRATPRRPPRPNRARIET